MCIYPRKYTKENFLKFLSKYDVNKKIIIRFAELPDTIIKGGYEYKLDVTSTWYDIDDTYYNFEMNYYNEELIEYLFSSKVFKDVEFSINNLTCELVLRGYLK